MNAPTMPCQSCGTLLASCDAVCGRCEGELPRGDTVSRFRCPACRQGFQTAAISFHPATAPWYRWRVQRPACPHCHAVLRDRRVAKTTRWQMLLYVTLIIAGQFLPGAYLPKLVFGATLLCYLYLTRARTLAGVPPWERYVPDDSPAHPPLI
ncbi:MAG: hypothetical protein H6R14_1404 [Proteobacteria bacterium]|nr:hypothetical protein [Pseudomonadota bacterium]